MTAIERTLAGDDQTRGQGSDQRGLAPINAVSRKDAVGIQIRRSIVLGHLKPGDKLTETQLAADLCVSRPTIREALNQLAGEGLIVQEPYRGLRVADITAQQVRDIAAVRMQLDMLAIDAIRADSTGRRLATLEVGWRHFASTAYSDDFLVRHEGHLAFHQQVWVASENHLLLGLWPVIQAHITIALAEDQLARSDPERAYRLHAEMMEVIRGGDRAAIESVLVAHTISSAEDLATLLEQAED